MDAKDYGYLHPREPDGSCQCAEGYSKSISNVNGVAYIGAGCLWFTLEDALKHWQNHPKKRDVTLCILESAKAIADLKGWKYA